MNVESTSAVQEVRINCDTLRHIATYGINTFSVYNQFISTRSCQPNYELADNKLNITDLYCINYTLYYVKRDKMALVATYHDRVLQTVCVKNLGIFEHT